MEKKQYEDNQFVLYSPDSLNYVTNNAIVILCSSLESYKRLFDITEYRKVQLHLFDSNEDFQNYIFKLRGENESLPAYAQGTFDNGMINLFIGPNIDINSKLYQKAIHTPSHELFHLMYKEIVWGKTGKRIVWFDEGMAQLFSGESDNIIFKDWFNDLVNSTKEIPIINNLEHGKDFMNDSYDGYCLSLLAVKYLNEMLGIDEFKKLINNNAKILEYGNTVLDDAFSYYGNKLDVKMQK